MEEIEADGCCGAEDCSDGALLSVVVAGEEEGEDDEGIGEGVEGCDEALVSCDGEAVDELSAANFLVGREEFGKIAFTVAIVDCLRGDVGAEVGKVVGVLIKVGHCDGLFRRACELYVAVVHDEVLRRKESTFCGIGDDFVGIAAIV